MNIFGTLVVCVAFGAGAALAGTTLGQTHSNETETFEKTCHYFQIRTERLSQMSDRSWLPVLAESCAAALENIGRAPETVTDRVYLERLNQLRKSVIAMNIDRLTSARDKTRPQFRVTVTGSGEYLIAHYIGVFDAYETWAHVNGFETAALPEQP